MLEYFSTRKDIGNILKLQIIETTCSFPSAESRVTRPQPSTAAATPSSSPAPSADCPGRTTSVPASGQSSPGRGPTSTSAGPV